MKNQLLTILNSKTGYVLLLISIALLVYLAYLGHQLNYYHPELAN